MEISMNTIWSTYVQNIGTLYDSRSLRFSDFFQSKYKEIFEIEDKKKILLKKQSLIENILKQFEEQFSKEQENRDKELTYWDNYYAALRDQRTEYNAWAKQMIESGSDEILAYLKANDQEYLASSEAVNRFGHNNGNKLLLLQLHIME